MSKKTDKKSPADKEQSPDTEREFGQIRELRRQLEECTERWKRALADYQNLQKRTEVARKAYVQFALKDFAEKLLEVIDDLKRCQEHLEDEGLGLALKKFLEVLKSEGIEKINTVGRTFDISTMEAVEVVKGKEDNKVVEEIRPGYSMHNSVIRAAQVKVSKTS